MMMNEVEWELEELDGRNHAHGAGLSVISLWRRRLSGKDNRKISWSHGQQPRILGTVLLEWKSISIKWSLIESVRLLDFKQIAFDRFWA